MHPRCCRPATSWVHYTTNCNTQSSAPEDGQNNCLKHAELTGIINKLLLLHLVGCLYYIQGGSNMTGTDLCVNKQHKSPSYLNHLVYQWCMAKKISDNEIYLLIKYINSVLRRVLKRLSYIQDARCLRLTGYKLKWFQRYMPPNLQGWWWWQYSVRSCQFQYTTVKLLQNDRTCTHGSYCH